MALQPDFAEALVRLHACSLIVTIPLKRLNPQPRVKVAPGLWDAHANLGNALFAIGAFPRTGRVAPRHHASANPHVWTTSCTVSITIRPLTRRRFQRAHAWADCMKQGSTRRSKSHEFARRHRKLRVGYVCGDFRDTAVRLFHRADPRRARSIGF